MTDPNVQLRGLLTTVVNRMCRQALDMAPRGVGKSSLDSHQGPTHPYIRLVNREAEKLLRAFRAVSREHVRQQPGRAQKGAVDAAVRSVTPKIAKALKT